MSDYACTYTTSRGHRCGRPAKLTRRGMRCRHHEPDAVLHWRAALRGGFVRTDFSLCGLRATGAGVEFTSRPAMITCPACRKEKLLRAAIARRRLAGASAQRAGDLAATREPRSGSAVPAGSPDQVESGT